MKKKIFTLLAILMMVGTSAWAAAKTEGDFGTNLHWKIDTNVKSLTITNKTTGTATVTPEAMPDWSSQKAQPWFMAASSITSIIIGEDITVIGGYNFYSFGKVTNVYLGSGVKEIKDNAFTGCNKATFHMVGCPDATSKAFGNAAEHYMIIELTDGSYMGTSADNYLPFSAAPTYTRQLAAGQTMGTLVLPFAIKNNSSDYKLGYVSDASVYGITVSEYDDDAEIAAGTPIFFQAATAGAELTFTASSTGLSITNEFTNSCTADGWTMNGTFSAITSGNASVDGGKQVYYIGTDDHFYYANIDFPCNAFRGWLETTETRPAGAPTRIDISFVNDEATGLNAAENGQQNEKFLLNGQLFIRMGGQVYDATGRVVK